MLDRRVIIGGKPTITSKVFKQIVLFSPTLENPFVEFSRGFGDVFDGEAAPVHIYGLWGAALEVDRAEGEDVLAILAASRFELVCRKNGARRGLDLRDAFVS